MPRYFFNYRINSILEKDPEGAELPSDTAALDEARLAARELLAAKVRQGEWVDGDAFEVTLADGTVVHTLPLRSVLKLDHDIGRDS
ncbi:hypothetical protein [Neorhizobium sp. JUb45]|uniref:DUF6894 family protein n=1 Tax=Neorhizobium sp. JUb45 TaxID=2485113 RepID=UPI00104A6CD2|nr:hypothetical protein [Neorhizobium sp. JUb45]TCR00417.1 hypothetical protein EDF70_10630 [Neorhizobium sp. JUb45]